MSSNDDIKAKRLQRLAYLASLNSQNDQSSENDAKQNNLTSTKDSNVTKPHTQTVATPSAVVSKDPIKTEKKTEIRTKIEDPNEIIKGWIISKLTVILQSNFLPGVSGGNYQGIEAAHPEIEALNANDFKKFVDLFLNDNVLDRIILENLTEIGKPDPLEFLFEVWMRADQALRVVQKKEALKKTSMKDADKEIFIKQKSILAEVVRLTCSYGFLAFQVPDMFINGSKEIFITTFIKNLSKADFIDFCVAIIKESKEQDSLLELLNCWLPSLSTYLVTLNDIDMTDTRYISILNFYLVMLSDKEITSIFTEIDTFNTNFTIEAVDIEYKTLLGPVLRVAPLGMGSASKVFDRSLSANSRYEIAQIFKTVQSHHKNLINTYIFPICDRIVRGGKNSRDGLLKYFSDIINANHLRTATQPDYSKLSSHGFIANINLVLLKLSSPFLGTDFKKIDKIDIDYFEKNTLLNIDEETRVNSTIKDAQAHFDKRKSSTPPNFISDCYYLTLTYLQYGFNGVSQAESKANDIKKFWERKLNTMKAQMQSMTGPTREVYEKIASKQIAMLEKKLSDVKSEIDSYYCFFQNEEFSLLALEFATSSCVFLTRVIEPTHTFPFKELRLPFHPDHVTFENIDNADMLRELSPVPFRYFPEYCIQSIIEYVSYISKYQGNPLINNKQRLNYFIDFAVMILRCPELISNPHLKGKLVECLFFGSTSPEDFVPGFMIDSFNTNTLALNHLLYSLLDFYVMVERTGASSQFYDKFNSRFYISTIIEKLWEIPHYREQLKLYSEEHESFFIRFVARMLNDTTYLLDESLGQLISIHHLSYEVEGRSKTGDLDKCINMEYEEVTMDELNTRLQSAERQAQSYIRLSNKTIQLFNLFTKRVPKGFTKSEIVDRLAGMLDYNLNQLVGPKYGELKVKNPEKYDFKPLQLLKDIARIYINLSSETEFVKAVARDARSFKKELFMKAHSILSRHDQLDSSSLKELDSFAEHAEKLRIEEEEEEEEWGDDVPEEFLDPLMFTLMKEPVILPSSKVVIDLSTIKAHLLSDPTDPFNRIPLKLEQVVPDEELKKKIEAFKLEKKKQKGDVDVEMTS